MKYIKWYLTVAVLFIGLTSCEDQETIEDAIVGRAWTGDVGMNAVNGELLFSTFEFGYDGFGEETQYYQSGEEYYDSFRFQWYWDNEYENNLILDYGKLGVSYMDNVHINGRYMTGIFYLEDGARGFNFSLKME